MLRGPANAAVTTGRYLLRSLADRDNPDTFTESKMLSFADSQSDMKELERNFREPEEAFFFDQLFVSSVRRRPTLPDGDPRRHCRPWRG